MQSVEQLNDLRRKIVAGEEVSKDVLRGAIQQLVGERLAAHAAEKPKGKAKAATPVVDLDSLLSRPQ